MTKEGLEVAVCETCCIARGFKRGEEIPGTKIGSITNDFSRMASEADRLVTIAR
jgi:sulfur relay (sulfurtransferase) complex TusBCD TusD component (DsrE family)